MSVPFRFSVGPDKQEFWMHRALVAQQSPVLDRLVNGDFKEAQDLHAELEYVDQKTFHYFWQYAYNGDYGESYTKEELSAQGKIHSDTHPPPCPGESLKEILTWEAELEFISLLYIPGFGVPPKYWNSKTPWKKFTDAVRYFNPPEAVPLKPLPNSQTINRNRVYTRSLFISHARLYVFADYYQVPKLADISFYRLGDALVNHDLTNNMRVEDAVELLRYCFDDPKPEKLRDIMMLYAVSKIESLIENAEFCKFLEDHGELSTACIRAMVNESVALSAYDHNDSPYDHNDSSSSED